MYVAVFGVELQECLTDILRPTSTGEPKIFAQGLGVYNESLVIVRVTGFIYVTENPGNEQTVDCIGGRKIKCAISVCVRRDRCVEAIQRMGCCWDN